MVTKQQRISIKAHTTKHAVFLMLLGVVIALVTLLVSQWYWRDYQLVLIFCFLTALVFFITGVAKKSEPKHSIILTPDILCYQHRYGQWQVQWPSINKITLLRETTGLAQVLLPYIGIQLASLDALAPHISARLANRLIHEQKPLISLAIQQGYITMEQGIISFEPYILSCGKTIKGPIAAFLHHSNCLHQAFGCHLFLPASSMDREVADFHSLLQQCLTHVRQQQ